MFVLLVLLAILFVLAAFVLFCIFPSMRKHEDRKLLDGLYIAHRGLHNIKEGVPENSLSAFRRAVENGFAIENDIHLTADGEVVVFHDDDLHRMCGVDGKIEEKTLAELKALALAGTDEKIPTLAECLDVIGGKVPLLIEFKATSGSPRALCEAANKVLEGYDGKYFIQSFYPPVLYWYRKNRKEICRGQLSCNFHESDIKKKALEALLFNFLARPDFVSYNHFHSKNPFRRFCTFLGAFPVAWTIGSKEELDAARKHFKTYIFEGFLPK